MKTKNLFFGLIAIVAIGFTSCEKEEDPAPVQPKIVVPVEPPADTTTITDTTVTDTVVVIAPHPYEIDFSDVIDVDDSYAANGNVLVFPSLVADDLDLMQITVVKFHDCDPGDTLLRFIEVMVWDVNLNIINDTTVTAEDYALFSINYHFTVTSNNLQIFDNDNWTINVATLPVDSMSYFGDFIRINGMFFLDNFFLSDLTNLQEDFMGGICEENANEIIPEFFKVAMVNNFIIPTKITTPEIF